MILSKSDQAEFGKLAEYLREEVPKLKHDPEVINAFVELTDVKRQDILQALEWGRSPTVKIVFGLKCNGEAAGCFRKGNPHQIEVEGNLVHRYETGEESKFFTTQKRSRVPYVGATVLHELVHWADYRVDSRRTEVSSFYHDIGSKWEWIVFGEATEQTFSR